jgi:hypothetical protein
VARVRRLLALPAPPEAVQDYSSDGWSFSRAAARRVGARRDGARVVFHLFAGARAAMDGYDGHELDTDGDHYGQRRGAGRDSSLIK